MPQNGHGQATKPVEISMDTNNTVLGEYEVNLLATTDPQEFVLPLVDDHIYGKTAVFLAHVTSKAGTDYTSLDLEFVDTDATGTDEDSINTILLVSSITPSAGVPDKLINSLTGRQFNTKGTVGNIGLVIRNIVGGAGDSDWTINIQVYGEAIS